MRRILKPRDVNESSETVKFVTAVTGCWGCCWDRTTWLFLDRDVFLRDKDVPRRTEMLVQRSIIKIFYGFTLREGYEIENGL